MKELLQQALDALLPHSSSHGNSWRSVEDAAIKAIEQALAQQEQPASVDAYVGAREDAAIWKKRALEAEELNRKFIAEINGQTYLGEPVKQEQPAAVAYELEAVKFANGKKLVYQKPKNLASYIKVRTLVYADTAPTQPALSDDEILNCFYASKSEGMVAYILAVGRAIEAHCRRGQA